MPVLFYSWTTGGGIRGRLRALVTPGRADYPRPTYLFPAPTPVCPIKLPNSFVLRYGTHSTDGPNTPCLLALPPCPLPHLPATTLAVGRQMNAGGERFNGGDGGDVGRTHCVGVVDGDHCFKCGPRRWLPDRTFGGRRCAVVDGLAAVMTDYRLNLPLYTPLNVASLPADGGRSTAVRQAG